MDGRFFVHAHEKLGAAKSCNHGSNCCSACMGAAWTCIIGGSLERWTKECVKGGRQGGLDVPNVVQTPESMWIAAISSRRSGTRRDIWPRALLDATWERELVGLVLATTVADARRVA
jgi:hypothetical protein